MKRPVLSAIKTIMTNKQKHIVLAITGIGFFVVIIITYLYQNYNKEPSSVTEKNSAIYQNAHQDWLSYQNNTYGYTIQYPSEWKAEAFPAGYNESSDGVVLTNIPSGGVRDSDQGDYYLNLMVYPNINMSLEEWMAWFNNADKDFFAHTELIDMNGLKFVKGTFDIPNNNMHGGWTMKSNHYFTVKNNVGYFFKANYANSTDNATVEMLQTFLPTGSNQVLPTNNISGEFISFDIKTSNRNIYKNARYGFTLELPNSWTSYYVSTAGNDGLIEINFSLPQGYNDVGSFGSPIKILAFSKDKFEGVFDCKDATEPCYAPLPLRTNGQYFFGGYALVGDNMEDYCREQVKYRYFCDARNDAKKFLQKSFFLNAFKTTDKALE